VILLPAGGVPSAAPRALEVITLGKASKADADLTNARLLIRVLVFFMRSFLLFIKYLIAVN
jgi:hypothetical protein